ncbi:F0F1 ATP synthase subunit B [Nanchangia anserum]|uniref:ATP synthase subunit b n=1 Tax=Nanchangia anserum TaxID=2692125 RepID=A0A8I0GDE2_9ACTO|nr:F0F1 ATP synthase subunit B [Nanchangia anserum]MBD3689936.1 F0F1 ATP synthase subunit B [Nanchangia anserum]QOX82570.1 F0F1 ATP synthase subunit B [Nanchangia anserum]
MYAMNLLPAAAEGETPNLLFPTLPDLVWSAITIAIVFVVMWRFVVPTFTKTIDERNAEIERGVSLSKEAENIVANARTQADAEVAKARVEASDIRAQAQEHAAKTVAQAKSQADQEARRIVERAQREIDANRQAAEISLRTDVGLLASELAEKIVGEQLKDRELSGRVIDRFLDSLEVEASQKG